jgi:TPR repeat protein
MTTGGVLLLLMLSCPVDQAIPFCEALLQAERGDVDAQQYVAMAYLHGLGVAPDERAALGWYEKAASAGSAYAMSELGVLFELRRDYARAFEWYSRAARGRNAHALFRLGIMYQEGWHVASDPIKGLQLIEESARLNSSAAQHYLGLLYFQGTRVPKSYVRSYAWLNLAAPKGAQYARTRELVEKHLSPEQLAEAQKLSIEWSHSNEAQQTRRQ